MLPYVRGESLSYGSGGRRVRQMVDVCSRNGQGAASDRMPTRSDFIEHEDWQIEWL
jgi:hypothetical protein